MQPSGIISLITDFGLSDPYVGQMKGSILRQNPEAQLVDLSHAVPRQDITGAAIVLHSSYAFFPLGTVHLIVVDPGVGSQRRILAAEGDEQIFVAPDNGIFSLLLRDKIISRVYRVEQRELFADTVSSTFHGRDIMGPVAAVLAGGLDVAAVGPEVSLDSCVCFDLPVACVSEKYIRGQVLQIDHFGNIRTTIRSTDLEHLKYLEQHFTDPQRCRVQMNAHQIEGISTTYAEVKPRELVALVDSAGYLEIAVYMGSAAELIQCRIGDLVQVDCLSE